MSRYFFRLPDVGEGVAEAEVVAWHIKVGDLVQEDQPLADVMTDKATIEISSPVDGRVTAVNGEIGGMVPVGAVLVEFDVAGEGDASAKPGPAPQAVTQPSQTVSPPPSFPGPPETRPLSAGAESPLAAPATRRRAYERGVLLEAVPGSGPGGRITPQDLESYLASQKGQARSQGLSKRTRVHETKIIGLRRKIAERMQEAKRRIPHINYVEECDLTELEALRADLNASRRQDQPKLTLLPFFMRAMVRVLPDFPQINAHYDDDEGVLRMHDGVHIGIATQTPGGLMAPVVRHAESRDLWDCAREVSRLANAARSGTATRDELTGSTITVTSMGVLGGVMSTPVINHPEVAIINPNKLVERPVVRGSFITVRRMMNLSSAFDHRIVDGYDAASFIQRLKRMLEHPALIFMD